MIVYIDTADGKVVAYGVAYTSDGFEDELRLHWPDDVTQRTTTTEYTEIRSCVDLQLKEQNAIAVDLANDFEADDTEVIVADTAIYPNLASVLEHHINELDGFEGEVTIVN